MASSLQRYEHFVTFVNFIISLTHLGIDVHSLAEPTKLAFLKQEFEKQKAEAKDETKQKLFEKYGGEVSIKNNKLRMQLFPI